MTDYTRRLFLHRVAASLGFLTSGWVLGGCRAGDLPLTSEAVEPSPATAAPTATTAGPTNGAEAPATSPNTPTVEDTVAPAPTATSAPSASHPDLAVARGGDADAMVSRAVAALGGMERFVKAGDDVIVKPNICVAYHTYEYAATTNPWVVGTLVRLALEAGARRVRVMDYPFGGSAEQAYVNSGIKEQVERAGGEMEVMSRFKFVDADIPAGIDLQRCKIYDAVLKADVVIDVPIAKHHNLARLTLGMKNLMGVIWDRPAMHRNLGQRLADLSSRVRPTLTVVDAVRMLMNHGPTGGNLDDVKTANTVIVSPDLIAADSYAATLFDLAPSELAYVTAGAAMGLGSSDLQALKIEEITVGG